MGDNIYESLDKANAARKRAEQKNKELYKENSKAKLGQNLEKKIRTTFIGAINSVENTFGHLWGHGKKWDDLTANERENRILWEKCRKEVLDKGNNELRGARVEVSEYTVEWNRFHKNLPVLN